MLENCNELNGVKLLFFKALAPMEGLDGLIFKKLLVYFDRLNFNISEFSII